MVLDIVSKCRKNIKRVIHSRVIWILILNVILIIIPIFGFYYIKSRDHQDLTVRGMFTSSLNKSIRHFIKAGSSPDLLIHVPVLSPFQRIIIIDSTENRIYDSRWLRNERLESFEIDPFFIIIADIFIDEFFFPDLEQREILDRMNIYIESGKQKFSTIDYRFIYSIQHVFLQNGSKISSIVLMDKSDIIKKTRLYKLILLFISGISILAAIIVSTIYYRLFIKPLLVLTREVELIKDLEKIPAKIFSMKDREDEIGLLSKAFYASALELVRRKEAIEIFTGDVLHELKNPLTGIRNGIEILQQREGPNNANTAGEILSIVSRESGRIEKLLFDIRKYSQFDQKTNFMETCSPEKIIAEVLTLYSQAGIALTIPDDDYQPIRLSREELVCILTNLVDNALDFSPEFGSISIKYLRRNNNSFLIIDDKGPGVPDSDKNKIFHRFYTNRGNQQGLHSGLGLSIIKNILETNNHSIQCLDNIPSGCSFIVKFYK